MSCTNFETDIALYAGGDLPAEQAALVDLHLAECTACRALLEDLRAGQTLLREWRGDPFEEALVAQVHRRVFAKIGAPRPARLYWKLALAAALVLTVVLAWPRHRALKRTPVARVEAPQIAAAPAQKVVLAGHRVVRRRHRAPASKPGPPLLVQFVTDDPNIVVYWLVEQKPQGD